MNRHSQKIFNKILQHMQILQIHVIHKNKISKIFLNLKVLQIHTTDTKIDIVYLNICHKQKIITKILQHIQILQIYVMHKKYQEYFLPSIIHRCMVWINRTQYSIHEHTCHKQKKLTKILPHIQILQIHVIHKVKSTKNTCQPQYFVDACYG